MRGSLPLRKQAHTREQRARNIYCREASGCQCSLVRQGDERKARAKDDCQAGGYDGYCTA